MERSIYEKLAAAAALMFVAAVAVYVLLLNTTSYLTSLAIDDALYYPVVAHSIATGAGSSFDGVTSTNGYHPLWCWIAIPFSLFASNLVELVPIFKIQVVCTVIVMLVIWVITLRRYGVSLFGRAVFVLLLGGSYFWSIKVLYSGMETPLVILGMGLTMLALRSALDRPTGARFLLLGIFLGFTFLARLDSIFFVAAVLAYLAFHSPTARRLGMLSATSFGFIVSPYLVWNLVNFGSIVPVSGEKKMLPAREALEWNLVQMKIFWLDQINRASHFLGLDLSSAWSLATLVVVLFGATVLFKRVGLFRVFKYPLFFVLACGAILHFLYNVLFMREFTVNWYQYMVWTSLYVALSLVYDYVKESRSLRFGAYTMFLVLLLSCFAMLAHARSRFPRSENLRVLQTALFSKASLPSSAVVGMVDPGIFRVVSGLRTIGFNGLIADRRIMYLAQQSRFDEIVEEYNVEYYIAKVLTRDLERIPCDLIHQSEPYEYASYSGISARVCVVKAKDYWGRKIR